MTLAEAVRLIVLAYRNGNLAVVPIALAQANEEQIAEALRVLDAEYPPMEDYASKE